MNPIWRLFTTARAPRISTKRTIGVTLGLLTIALTAAVALTTTSAQAQTEPALGFGISVQGGEGVLVVDTEQTVERQLDSVRLFATWNDNFPLPVHMSNLDGRDIILSVRPRANGVPIPWADIAAAQPGDPLHNDMVRWANAIKPYEDQIWISFHHEAEAEVNFAHGEADDFIAAWQKFMTCLLYTSPSPRDRTRSRMPSSA